MKHLFLIILTSCFIWASAQNNNNKGDIVGIFTQEDLMQSPYKNWFDAGYQYLADIKVIDKLNKMPKNYNVIIILGTWCSDSQEQVPRFLKILSDISFDTKQLLLVGVNHEKKIDNFDIDKYKIERVPTFIILKNKQEIGRITEIPEKTLEEDLLKILSE